MEGLLLTLLYIAIIGVVVWLITTYLPMPPIFRTIIIIAAAIIIIYLLITSLGGHGHTRLGFGIAGFLAALVADKLA